MKQINNVIALKTANKTVHAIGMMESIFKTTKKSEE
jgi:hypothetical protein